MAKRRSKTMLAVGDLHIPRHDRRAVEVFCRGRRAANRTKVKTPQFASPASDALPPMPYKFSLTGSGIILADVHVPYHDQQALDIAINHAIRTGHTDYLVILGDLIDHYQLSRYAINPEARNFAGEVATVRQLLTDLARVFNQIVYKAGNHEQRYEDYMRLRAPALIGVPQFAYTSVMGLTEAGVDWVPWNAVIHVGDRLTLVHGHEFGGSVCSPVNPARGLFLRTKACALCGHYHQSSQHDEPNVRGQALTTWSLGCLCNLHPEYLPFNKWNHGFIEFDTAGGDDWQLANRRIVKGTVR